MSTSEPLHEQEVKDLQSGDEISVIVEARSCPRVIAIVEVVSEPYAWGGNPGNPTVDVRIKEYKSDSKLRDGSGDEFEVGDELPVGVGQLFDVSAADD